MNPDAPSRPSLLADLESRQEELLRLLSELEERTKQALAGLEKSGDAAPRPLPAAQAA